MSSLFLNGTISYRSIINLTSNKKSIWELWVLSGHSFCFVCHVVPSSILIIIITKIIMHHLYIEVAFRWLGIVPRYPAACSWLIIIDFSWGNGVTAQTNWLFVWGNFQYIQWCKEISKRIQYITKFKIICYAYSGLEGVIKAEIVNDVWSLVWSLLY